MTDTYDPNERTREKQRARDKDAADLASGAKTHEDLIRENSFVRAGKGPIDFAKVASVMSALDLLDAWTDRDPLWRSGHHSMMLGPDKMRRYTLTYRDGDRTAQANGYGPTLEAAILDALGKAPK